MNKNEAKILIVDDIEDNRYTLERSLKKDGYENIALADCGKDALNLVNESKFDLILLDLQKSFRLSILMAPSQIEY